MVMCRMERGILFFLIIAISKFYLSVRGEYLYSKSNESSHDVCIKILDLILEFIDVRWTLK